MRSYIRVKSATRCRKLVDSGTLSDYTEEQSMDPFESPRPRIPESFPSRTGYFRDVSAMC